jgi:hypothetical protein
MRHADLTVQSDTVSRQCGTTLGAPRNLEVQSVAASFGTRAGTLPTRLFAAFARRAFQEDRIFAAFPARRADSAPDCRPSIKSVAHHQNVVRYGAQPADITLGNALFPSSQRGASRTKVPGRVNGAAAYRPWRNPASRRPWCGQAEISGRP